MDKLKAFFATDFGEIVAHVIVALAMVILILIGQGWMAIVLALLLRELEQHEWSIFKMGVQSHLEWIVPSFVVIAIWLRA